MDTVTTHSLDEMQAFAHTFMSSLHPHAHATVLALTGDLGAGKTSFTQALSRELGVTSTVTSPTFVVLKKYETENAQFQTLIHIDAYRIESAVELQILGIESLLQDPSHLIVIEWAERVADLIPEDAIRMTFTHGDGDTRIVTYGEY